MGVINKTDGRSSTSIELTDTLRILMTFVALVGAKARIIKTVPQLVHVLTLSL